MTELEAYRAAIDTFLAKWTADAPALNGGLPIQVLFEGVAEGADAQPVEGKPYAAVRVESASSRRLSIGSPALHEHVDQIQIAIAVPLKGDAPALALQLAKIARDAFENVSTDDVEFLNARIVGGGEDTPFYFKNVIADLRYYEEVA